MMTVWHTTIDEDLMKTLDEDYLTTTPVCGGVVVTAEIIAH